MCHQWQVIKTFLCCWQNFQVALGVGISHPEKSIFRRRYLPKNFWKQRNFVFDGKCSVEVQGTLTCWNVLVNFFTTTGTCYFISMRGHHLIKISFQLEALLPKVAVHHNLPQVFLYHYKRWFLNLTVWKGKWVSLSFRKFFPLPKDKSFVDRFLHNWKTGGKLYIVKMFCSQRHPFKMVDPCVFFFHILEWNSSTQPSIRFGTIFKSKKITGYEYSWEILRSNNCYKLLLWLIRFLPSDFMAMCQSPV